MASMHALSMSAHCVVRPPPPPTQHQHAQGSHAPAPDNSCGTTSVQTGPTLSSTAIKHKRALANRLQPLSWWATVYDSMVDGQLSSCSRAKDKKTRQIQLAKFARQLYQRAAQKQEGYLEPLLCLTVSSQTRISDASLEGRPLLKDLVEYLLDSFEKYKTALKTAGFDADALNLPIALQRRPRIPKDTDSGKKGPANGAEANQAADKHGRDRSTYMDPTYYLGDKTFKAVPDVVAELMRDTQSAHVVSDKPDLTHGQEPPKKQARLQPLLALQQHGSVHTEDSGKEPVLASDKDGDVWKHPTNFDNVEQYEEPHAAQQDDGHRTVSALKAGPVLVMVTDAGGPSPPAFGSVSLQAAPLDCLQGTPSDVGMIPEAFQGGQAAQFPEQGDAWMGMQPAPPVHLHELLAAPPMDSQMPRAVRFGIWSGLEQLMYALGASHGLDPLHEFFFGHDFSVESECEKFLNFYDSLYTAARVSKERVLAVLRKNVGLIV